MSTTHSLKCWPEYYERVADGRKKLELRYNDRGFQTGDVLHLREWEPMTQGYTGQSLFARVTEIVGQHATLSPGCVAMSIEVME
jgi:ASC-1-like (ASCH) protein